MKKFRRFTALLLCAALLLSGSTFANAATKTTTVYKTEKLYTAKETYILPMWHYSGNYWKIGSGSSAQKVTDKVIDQYNSLADYLTANYSSITYRITLPDAVKKARQNGSEIRTAYESRGNAPMDAIFSKGSIRVITDVSDGKDYFEFSVAPIYNLVKKYDFTTFVSGLGKSIPLISSKYGQNIYSIFGNGVNAVQANGFFNESCLSDISVPYMHPSFIADRNGTLSAGSIISLGGKTVSTKGYTVGQNTFSNAGACGISFVFPINVIFTAVTAAQVITEIPDSGQPGEDSGETNPGQETDPGNAPEPHIEPEPAEEPDPDFTDIHAILSLPEEAYEGQTVTAQDNSTFDFNGTFYSASGAYTKGIASGRFDHPGAEYRSKTKTSMDIAYPEAGIYCVTLDIDAASGEEASDAKVITILPCPSVSASVGGRQLENRKQSLCVTVQQNPKYPIKELKIRISEAESGESISISRNFSGAQAKPANSAHIKYRSLYDAGSDENSLVSQVDFLSKFSDDRVFTYEVYAADSRGRSDRTTGSFKVAKDTPPEARIGIASCYYRERDSDTAVITLSDESRGSGNFLRTWTYEGSNFMDSSFGTGKNVSFERKGVGKFTVGLSVKDLWTDETLEEYVTDADHLCSSTSASSVVDNIAPVVSLEMRSAAGKEILLLASDKNTREALESSLPSLKAELAGRGINADIHVELSLSRGIGKTGDLRFVRQISTPSEAIPSGTTLYYRHMDSKFWSCGHVTADASAVYSMDSGNFVRTGTKNKYALRSYPFYIKAYDSRTGSEKWSFTITEALFRSADNFENAVLGHDEQGKCLYLISDGKTMIIDKSNGSYVGMLDTELGEFNFIQDGEIYTFKSDGIFRCSASGAVKICGGQLFTGLNRIRTLGGRVRFTEMKNGTVCLGSFDPKTGTVSSVKLAETDSLSECMSIDTRGRVLIRLNEHTFAAYDLSGKKTGTRSLNESVSASVPSYDGSGRVNYVAGSYRERTGGSSNRKYYNYMVTCGLFSPFAGTNYVMRKDDYRSFSDAASAIECAGTVAATLPALVIVGDSSPLYSMTEFNFNTADGTNDCGILVSTGMPPTGYVGWFEGGSSISLHNSVYNNIAMLVNMSESENDETERLKAKWLSSPDGVCIKVSGSIDADTIMNAIGKPEETTQPPSRMYRKNEAIDYRIFYSDYEGDPSAASYWLYTHEPGRDGLWENSGKILNAPVTSFSKEGRYTLVHWQKDDAGRGLTAEYDKESNRCTMVFYVSGGDASPQDGGNTPPQITNITTEPQSVHIGEDCSIRIKVDDPDGDDLEISVEVFRSGNDEAIKTWSGSITPSDGVYPEIIVPGIAVTGPGTYEIIVTASDGKAADVESASFTPLAANALSAAVDHTENWESNRRNFNENNFNDPFTDLISDLGTYAASASPRRRGRNVFWPGEKLILNAQLSGDTVSVSAQALGYSFSTVLTDSGNGSFTGTLYDSSMKTVFDTGSPLPVTVRFTATYENSAPLTFDVPIIFDQDTGYWALHRTR